MLGIVSRLKSPQEVCDSQGSGGPKRGGEVMFSPFSFPLSFFSPSSPFPFPSSSRAPDVCITSN